MAELRFEQTELLRGILSFVVQLFHEISYGSGLRVKPKRESILARQCCVKEIVQVCRKTARSLVARYLQSSNSHIRRAKGLCIVPDIDP